MLKKSGFTLINRRTIKGNHSGFTLIELMVVIAIIGILSVIGYSTYSNIQASARDAKRKADVDAISKSLEDKYDPATGIYLRPVDLIGRDFTSGSVPTDNGTDYWFRRSNNNKAFVVCTNTLEKSTQPYCKYSANGNTTDIASLSIPASPSSDASPTASASNPAGSSSPSFTQQVTFVDNNLGQPAWKSFGLLVSNSYTLGTLCQALISGGGSIAAIQLWSQGSWVNHLCSQQDPDTNTPVKPGDGIFILPTNSQNSTSLSGTAASNISKYSLAKGNNFISFVTLPAGVSNASQLYSLMNQQVNVDAISESTNVVNALAGDGSLIWNKYTTGSCDALKYVCVDFSLSPGVTYSVNVTTVGGGTYTPAY